MASVFKGQDLMFRTAASQYHLIISVSKKVVLGMNQVQIVTDSTADLPEKLVNDYNIAVVPLKVIFDGKELPGWCGYQYGTVLPATGGKT